MKILIVFLICLILFACLVLIDRRGTMFFFNVVLFFMGTLLFWSLLLATQLFYVELTEDEIMVRNPVFPFWKTVFSFTKVTLIIIGNPGGRSSDYIQIITPTKKSMRYVIDLVGRKNYPNLVQDLHERGIKVELKGIKLD